MPNEPRNGHRPRPPRSATDRFEHAYRRCGAALRRPDNPDLSASELTVLACIGDDAVALGRLAADLALPKSTASVLVKGLERRGFLRRKRDPGDERRLAIVLTAEGRRRVVRDRVLDPGRLTTALRAVPRGERTALLTALEQVADAAERRENRAVT